MSSFQQPKIYTYEAAADLSAKQFHGVKITADHAINVAGAADAHGILMNKPLSGEKAEFAAPGGGAKAKIGAGGCSAGNSLKSASGGTLVAASAGDRAIAVAEQDGLEGDVIGVIVSLHQA